MYLSADRMDKFDVPIEIEAELYRARPVESYDVICIRGRLKTGAHFHFAVTRATERSVPTRLEIVGSKGRAVITQNGKNVSNSFGFAESEPSSPDPLLESMRQFIHQASPNEPKMITHMRDTSGYVLATKAALLSSGAIHHISGKYA